MPSTMNRLIEGRRLEAEAQAANFPEEMRSGIIPDRARLEANVIETAFHEAAHVAFALASPRHEMDWVTIEVDPVRHTCGHARYHRRPGCAVLGPGPHDPALFASFSRQDQALKTDAWRTAVLEVAILVAGPVRELLHSSQGEDEDDESLWLSFGQRPNFANDMREAITYVSPFQSNGYKCWDQWFDMALRVRPPLETEAFAGVVEKLAAALLDTGTLQNSDLEALFSSEVKKHLQLALERETGLLSEEYVGASE